MDTNYVHEPSFEQGTAGWSIPSGPGITDTFNKSVLKSNGSAPGMGIGGTNAVQLVTSGRIGSDQTNIATFDLPADGSINSPGTGQDVYVSVATYNADGSFFGEGCP